jgi:5-bromo-4-chloroindolyl phosphate hydrolysis protein
MKKWIILLIILYAVLVAGTIIGISMKKPKAHDIELTESTSSEQQQMLQVIKGMIPIPAGKDIELVKSEYMYSCSQISEAKNRLACVDKYFNELDSAYVGQKISCKQDKTCLDDLYWEMANTKNDAYCHAITEQDRRQRCIK